MLIISVMCFPLREKKQLHAIPAGKYIGYPVFRIITIAVVISVGFSRLIAYLIHFSAYQVKVIHDFLVAQFVHY